MNASRIATALWLGQPPADLKTQDSPITDFFSAAPFKPVISEAFLEKYEDQQPAWGPIGYVTYKRTYARPLFPADLGLSLAHNPDVPVRSEEFWESLCRIINGMWHIVRCHSARKNIEFSEATAMRKAENMFRRMWEFKWLPPGRGLWMMGTRFMYLKGSAALNNCGFVSTQNINKEHSEPFAWAMDMSMLGVGIGFDTRGAGLVEVKLPPNLADSDSLRFLDRLHREEFALPVRQPNEAFKEYWERTFDEMKWAIPDGTRHVEYYASTDDSSGKFRIHKRFMYPVKGKVFIVPDTREGWVESVALVIDSFLAGKNLPIFDYSEIRPEGSPIKGFGGVASGHVFLQKCHENLTTFLWDRVGKTLNASDIVDIFNEIGACVVSGNVRRSAQISFGDPSDTDFISLKHDFVNHPNCWNSNNSVFATIGMDYKDVARLIETRGEPGLFWIENARKYGRMGDANNKDKDAMGANPCITGDSWVHTSKGPCQIEELVGTQVECLIDGKSFPTTAIGAFCTGTKPVLKVTTSRGNTIKLTSNHKVMTSGGWLEAKNLKIGSEVILHNHRNVVWGEDSAAKRAHGWLLGSLLGDGHIDKRAARIQVWNDEIVFDSALSDLKEHISGRSDRKGCTILERNLQTTGSVGLKNLAATYNMTRGNKHCTSAIEIESSAFTESFLQGWFDADGSVQGTQDKGVSVRLSCISKEDLLAAQRMLARLGIISTIYKRREAGQYLLPDGKGGEKYYPCQTSYELVVANDNLQVFSDRINFRSPAKSGRLANLLTTYKRKLNKETFITIVEKIEDAGTALVYDLTIPGPSAFDANGLYVHNCSEQTLHNYELCCLVENFPSKHDSEEEFHSTLKQSYLYAKAVTLVPSHSKRTNRIMGRNSRIGCSLSGIQQARSKFGTRRFLNLCKTGYEYLCSRDEIYSDWLQVRQSIKKTSIKPSGTVSLLAGVSPGIHYPVALCYLRRIRFSKTNKMIPVLREAGYRIYDAPEQPDSTYVVDFPVYEQFDTLTETEASHNIWEQLEFNALMQEYWSDNQNSITVKFRSGTGAADEIARALELYETRLKAISFLPYFESEEDSSYEAIPYQSITKEQYQEEIKNLKPYSFTEKEIFDDLLLESCDMGVCPVR